MKAVAAALGISLMLLGSPPAAAPGSVPGRTERDDPPLLAADEADEVVREYCVRCHNDRRLRGNLSLERFETASAVGNAEVAERMIRKLRAGMMPPPGADRPDEATLDALATTLETRIDSAALLAPEPGARTFQRLNQAEYERSIRDLLALEVDAAAFLPPDTKSANFDNIADAQMLSPTLMEAYLNAASEISRLAVGDADAGPSETAYKVPRLASQTGHVDGTPFGARGGTSALHVFPADGDYVFRVSLHPTPTGQLFGRTAAGEQVEVSVDGVRVALLDIDRWMSQADPRGMDMTTAPVAVRAGPHRVAAAFLPRFEGPVQDVIEPIGHSLADTQIGLAYGITTLPHLRELVVSGPHRVTGVSDTPSRREIFHCRPTAPDEARPCAERILGRLATRAYRRPVGPGDVADLMAFYERGAGEGGFEIGVRTALQALLASPHFLFRFEEPGGPPDAAGLVRLADEDLAARLSFFLWGRPPDGELLALARDGRLGYLATLEAQVRRMLADERSEALGSRFAAQWLRLQDLDKVHPDALLHPEFDRQLAEDMRTETERFFHHLVVEDRSVLELLTADYTFANAGLARHYGIPGVAGDHFRRVAYVDDARRGVLGHGSVLTLTSHANRTSPVLRGKWVMEVLLGTPPPPPPPDVPDLEATEEAVEGRMLTVRERLEQHRSNPQCASCHRVIDPIGLALENFDVTGRWRIKDQGAPVDVEGELYDGTALASPADLRAALLDRPEPILRTFTENLLAYAVGRRVEHYDMPTVRAITRAAAAEDHRVSAYVLGVVRSAAFRYRGGAVVTDGAERHP
jgi:mono/diheme cytochrome c family protein